MTFAADVFFSEGSAALRNDYKPKLDALVEKVSDLNLEIVVAVGHTDSVGSDALNQKLSVQRAEAVKAYLTSKRVESNRIYTEGKGERQPVADNKTREGRLKNNRVEIEVVGTRSAGRKPAPPVADWQPDDRIPVLFATNRMRTGSDDPYTFYGNELSDRPDNDNVRRGIAVVKVPKNRVRGSVDRPGWIKVTLKRVANTALGKVVGLSRKEPADLQTQFSFEGKIEELTKSDFIATVADAVKKSTSKSAVLYIHGYKNDFADASFRAAQVVHDLQTPTYDLVPLMFSWPSDPGLLRMDYELARTRTQASGYDLARFLAEIASSSEIDTVHIVAHSMGAEVLGHALVKLGVNELGRSLPGGKTRPLFRQIVFAAPDVTPRIFEDEIEAAIRTNHSITTYATTDDLALWFSSLKNSQYRAGSAMATGRLPACVDTIDVSAVATGTLSHSSWAESEAILNDLRYVLKDALQPKNRGLTERRMEDRRLWLMPIKPVATAPSTGTPALAAAVGDYPCPRARN